MVQTYQSPVRVYKYPFELVMAAYERRFPTCKLIPVFLSSDILVDEWTDDQSCHVVERRCKLNVDAPYLLKKIVGVDYAYFIQKNSLDRRNRRLDIQAYNESFSSRVDVVEKCTYTAHPENPEWTCFEQSASLDVKSFFGFENTVEKIAMKQYSQNISKGKEIIEYYINELKQEGITYIPPYMDPVNPGTEIQPQPSELSRSRAGSVQSCGSGQLQLGASAENKFKLEAEYIARCVGELNPLQECRLIQLQKWVAELQKGKVPSDATLLRFLRAREFQVEKAREMLSSSLVWRKKFQVDRILSEYQYPPVIKDYFPGGWHHQDKEGRPLYLLRLGQMDVKGLIKSIGEEGLLKLTLHVCEEGLRRTEEATRELGKPISTWTLLVDLEGLNMRHLWRPGIKALLRIIEIVEDNYPETLSLVMIIRAPRVFPILWTIVSTFIHEHTRSKVLFYAGNDYQEEPGGLLEYIPDKYLPDFLGGSCQTSLVEGGLVPKSLYLSEEDQEKEREHLPLFDDSIYNSVSLAKGQVHEVLIMNEDRGSVICWDFDVMKQDLAFSVYRTKVPITSANAPTTPTGPLQTIQNINPLSMDPEHRSMIEKHWKEGSEYFKVETTVICHDGESIQGSHVTDHVGTYLLQWRFHESAPHHIMDSITQHKAKLMYYYESLSSSDYKGSMSSLRSSQSGFSSNTSKSMASSCPSR